MLNIIPAMRQSAVLAALQTTFNNTQLDKINLLHGGGSSSLTYQIAINEQDYVLRVMGLDQPLDDRHTQVDCLNKAAALNIAPHCYYANAEAGVIIMAYIPTKPIQDRNTFLINLAYIVKQLHQSCNLLPVFMSTFDYLDGLTNDLWQYPLPGFIKNYLLKVSNIQNILKPHIIKVPCHNDLNLGNILFDGNKIWLIDWEAAGVEDPFFDLAAVCNQFTFNEEMQSIFINTYFGQAPNTYQQAKLFLMQLITHHYYAVHFLNYAASGGKIIIDKEVPRLYEWNIGYNKGFYTLNSADDFLLYGLVQVKAFLAQIYSAGFLKAKSILSERY